MILTGFAVSSPGVLYDVCVKNQHQSSAHEQISNICKSTNFSLIMAMKKNIILPELFSVANYQNDLKNQLNPLLSARTLKTKLIDALVPTGHDKRLIILFFIFGINTGNIKQLGHDKKN